MFQINGTNILELSHNEVVSLIQGLPLNFRLIVARKRDENDDIITVGQEIKSTSMYLFHKLNYRIQQFF